jgi:hypothetical protein
MPYEPSPKDLPEGFVDLGEKSKPIELGNVNETEYHYPSLYFENAGGLEGLPKEGEATIYFKKVMERKETTSRNGKTDKRHTVELCIYGIKAKDSEMESEDKEDDEDEIENGLKEAEEDED